MHTRVRHMAKIIETYHNVRHMAEKSEADDLDKPCQHFQTEEVPLYLMCFKANGVPPDGSGLLAATGVLYYLMS